MTARRATALPFYAARLDSRGRIEPWALEDLQDFAARSGDPYGGRLAPGLRPALSLQLEASEDEPVFLGLAARELQAWSRALEAAWRRFGVERGDAVALFDYGSSPAVFLAAGSYVAYLRRGVADRLGLTTICNDGVASMAGRMLEILQWVRPAALVLRRDVLAPFAEALQTAGLSLAGRCRWVAVTEPDGAPPLLETRRYAELWQVPVHRLLRADAACFLAGSDPADPRRFLVERELYALEALGDGEVAVSARFARTCPSLRHRLTSAGLELRRVAARGGPAALEET